MNKVFAVLLCFLLCFQALANAEPVDQLAESLLKLRAEVEQLDSEVSETKELRALRLKTLKVQQGELSASIEAERLRRDQLKTEISELNQQLREKGFEDKQMKQVVIGGIDSLAEYVHFSAPFLQARRLSELEKLKNKVKADEITSSKVAIRLWSFVEDELRAATENTILRQKINLDGESHLVEVAKLGNLFLFFKTQSGSFGYAKKGQKTWKFQKFDSTSDEQKVSFLFESLEKQIRTGEFNFPNTLKQSL